MNLSDLNSLPEKMQSKYGSLEGKALETCPRCGEATVVVKMITPDGIIEKKRDDTISRVRRIRNSRKYKEYPEAYEKIISIVENDFNEWKSDYKGDFLPFCAPCTVPCLCGMYE